MNKLDSETRSRIIGSLVEGNSIASTCRMTGVAKMTVLSLLREVGTACQRFHDAQVRYLPTERLQCDEVWSFCYAKQKNVPAHLLGRDDVGSIWTWTAIDADSKLLASWIAGTRSLDTARSFISDLCSRLTRKVQLTTDGREDYLTAIIESFKLGDVDYAALIKIYGPSGNPASPESRYSPGSIKEIRVKKLLGDPDPEFISTSYMERWNLTLRMQSRRFTRLTNGFSKKFENHCHMLALTVVHYNYCRKHRSLGGRTPAMAAGLTDYAWSVADLLALDMWSDLAKAS
jgi:IS1 family transposase